MREALSRTAICQLFQKEKVRNLAVENCSRFIILNLLNSWKNIFCGRIQCVEIRAATVAGGEAGKNGKFLPFSLFFGGWKKGREEGNGNGPFWCLCVVLLKRTHRYFPSFFLPAVCCTYATASMQPTMGG